MNLFNRALVFTDLHLGEKLNSLQHNIDCVNFVDWAIQQGKTKNCDVCLFLGDFYHNRNTINVNTLNTGFGILEKLHSNFPTFMIPGNHDLYYKDRRDIQSIVFAQKFTNITVINDIIQASNCIFAPWLVGNDVQTLKNSLQNKHEFVFGHFELPSFLMNNYSVYNPHDEKGIRREDFRNSPYVYTGHFHKKQIRENIVYMGNAFGHKFSDADDFDRGIMILEASGDREFFSWPDAPTYSIKPLSLIIEDPEAYLFPNMYAKLMVDVDLTYEESLYIKETLIENHSLRDCIIIPQKRSNTALNSIDFSHDFESVDSMVYSQLANIQSTTFDPETLKLIYDSLGDTGE